MRRDQFLRTPIRSDHQALLQNLTVSEVALDGNPDPAASYPQTLEIRFDVAPSTKEVQIALPWEGNLRFCPDSTSNHPVAPSDVTIARYSTWAVTGDLLLQTLTLFESGLQDAFKTHLPLVEPFPALVRFSKVRLTQDFLFTTLAGLPKYQFIFDGAMVTSNDPLYLQRLIVTFLSGKSRVPFRLDLSDAAKDQTLLAMPSVSLANAGATTTLRITIASASENGLSDTWFKMRPEDEIPGELLVPTVIDNFTEQITNPAHPHHSVIPARFIFQHAAAAAYAPDHNALTPLRVALTAPLSGGLSYRKIEAVRPPLPGSEVSSAATRAYPMYRLCWSSIGSGATESLRLPLSGRVYVPIADGTYRFWVIPRSADPTIILSGDHVQLSLQTTPPARYIDVPSKTLDVALGTAPSARIFAHTHQYDSRMVWEGFRLASPNRRKLQEKARSKWGLPYVGCHNLEIVDTRDSGGLVEIETSWDNPLRRIGDTAPVVVTVLVKENGEEKEQDFWYTAKKTGVKRFTLQGTTYSKWHAKGIKARFSHGVCDWLIKTEREDYRELYGYFRESAGRHGLAPEFLQVVFFGEGGGLAIKPGFDAMKAIDTWGFVGLDLVLYRTGRLPIGAPPVPPEAVAEGKEIEIKEFTFNLVTNGYVDATTASAVTPAGRTEFNEIGRTIHVGTVTGWKAAIELVAAELHARRDEMTSYLAGKMPPISVVEEEQRRFLAYLRYSSRSVTAYRHADNLVKRISPWTAPLPLLGIASDPLPHFLSIQRLAVTECHESAAVYRSIIE